MALSKSACLRTRWCKLQIEAEGQRNQETLVLEFKGWRKLWCPRIGDGCPNSRGRRENSLSLCFLCSTQVLSPLYGTCPHWIRANVSSQFTNSDANPSKKILSYTAIINSLSTVYSLIQSRWHLKLTIKILPLISLVPKCISLNHA
jgi:hypothetical protein